MGASTSTSAPTKHHLTATLSSAAPVLPAAVVVVGAAATVTAAALYGVFCHLKRTTKVKKKRPESTTAPSDFDIAIELQKQEAVATSSISNHFFLYCKGLVAEDKKSKAKFGGVGIAIFDSEDALVSEMSKPLVLPKAAMTDQVAELEALVQGLELALSLEIGNVMFSYIDSLYPFLYGSELPEDPKFAELIDRAFRLWRRFLNFGPFTATGKNAEFVLQLARSSVENKAGRPFKEIIHVMEMCLICLEDVDSHKMFEIGGCQHRFCSSCITRHVQLKVRGRELPRCPQPDCGLELEINTYRRFLPRKMDDIVDQLAKESSIPDADKVYCPNPKCSYLMSKTEALAKTKGSNVCKCFKCKTLICVNCKVLWHSNMSCDSYKKGESNGEKLKLLAQKNNWKQCPKCFHMVARIDGCNRILCRCKTSFCYSCGHEYMTKGHYYSCLRH